MRTALADSLGLYSDAEKQKLLSVQEQGGSWPADALYREGKKPKFYGNKTVPTAFSIRALDAAGF
jgi:hypothetical protein